MNKLFEAVDEVFDKDRIVLEDEESSNQYVVEYNDGAVQRTQVENSTESFEGTREDLMEFLDDHYVECTMNDEDELVSFDEWLSVYEDEYDPSGSTVVLKITENGKEIYKNESYDYFMGDED